MNTLYPQYCHVQSSSTTELSMDRMRDKLMDFHKPSYDATAAVSIMRLERNSRKPG